MSRKMITLTMALMLVAGIATAGEMAWFDMDNCAMCKGISSNPEMMKNITWEQYNIDGGVISVTTVPMNMVADYRVAHAEMEKTVMKLHGGEKMDLCGSCTALGACMMKGVDQQYVETMHGDVWIVTSKNPEVVAEIQGWAKRNTEEMAKMKTEKS